MFDDKHPLFPAYRLAKRIIIGIVGGTVLLIGIAMIVLPGPALVVIPVGLGILSLEFAWARIWLKKIKERAQKVAHSIRHRGQPKPQDGAGPANRQNVD
ncbi:MAG TPA: PGPGW domain-containing protein [Steroidobacteraceae bacterium]|nr:PGPGW domain-containing protein [Steroidobacteraceae bacterium]